MEVFGAGATVLQFLLVFIHLGKAYDTIFIVFEIDVFAILWTVHGLKPAFESFGQLVVENLVCVFGDACAVFEVV